MGWVVVASGATEAVGFGLGDGAFAAADVAVGEIVTVRPSVLKVAITGIEAFTVTTAAPLPSL